MGFRTGVLALGFVLWVQPAGAAPADPVDTLVADLESAVTDLETAQEEVAGLKARLAALESVSADHLAELEAQETLLEEFSASVKALADHDRVSLGLAQDLKRQLDTERQTSRWLWPVAGAALAAAVVEGILLWK